MSNCKCGSEPLEHGQAEYTERFPQLDAVAITWTSRQTRKGKGHSEKSSGRARYHEGKIRNVYYLTYVVTSYSGVKGGEMNHMQ